MLDDDTIKQYAHRNVMELDRAGGFFCRHLSAMTGEKLHAKSDIAAELAWRDMRIAELERDAARWRFYCDHGSDMIDGQTLHAWIESNKLRYGGRQAAIDAAAIRKEGDDADL